MTTTFVVTLNGEVMHTFPVDPDNGDDYIAMRNRAKIAVRVLKRQHPLADIQVEERQEEQD